MAVFLGDALGLFLGRTGCVGIHDRQAHLLAGLKARIGLGPRAIDADLPRAEHLLDLALRDRHAALDPAIKPGAGFLVGNRFSNNLAAHANTFRAIKSPMNSAITPSINESPA